MSCRPVRTTQKATASPPCWGKNLLAPRSQSCWLSALPRFKCWKHIQAWITKFSCDIWFPLPGL